MKDEEIRVFVWGFLFFFMGAIYEITQKEVWNNLSTICALFVVINVVSLIYTCSDEHGKD